MDESLDGRWTCSFALEDLGWTGRARAKLDSISADGLAETSFSSGVVGTVGARAAGVVVASA